MVLAPVSIWRFITSLGKRGPPTRIQFSFFAILVLREKFKNETKPLSHKNLTTDHYRPMAALFLQHLKYIGLALLTVFSNRVHSLTSRQFFVKHNPWAKYDSIHHVLLLDCAPSCLALHCDRSDSPKFHASHTEWSRRHIS